LERPSCLDDEIHDHGDHDHDDHEACWNPYQRLRRVEVAMSLVAKYDILLLSGSTLPCPKSQNRLPTLDPRALCENIKMSNDHLSNEHRSQSIKDDLQTFFMRSAHERNGFQVGSRGVSWLVV
jgi:hypothetical protein